MSKSKDLLYRRVDVFAPTIETKQKWQHCAQAQGLSLSKYITHIVEQAIESMQAPQTEVEAIKERNYDLESEVVRLEKRVGVIQILQERAEGELEKYRAQEFLQTEGPKVLDSKLIEVLRESKTYEGKHRAVPNDELIRRLYIGNSPELIQSTYEQLKAFEIHGLLKETPKGWIYRA